MNTEILEALGAITREKNVERAVLVETLEAGLISAGKKKFGATALIQVDRHGLAVASGQAPFDAAPAFDLLVRLHEHARTHVAREVLGRAQAPLDSGRADLEDEPVRHGLVHLERVVEPARDQRAVLDGDGPEPFRAVDVDAQRPAAGLHEFDVDEVEAEVLDHRRRDFEDFVPHVHERAPGGPDRLPAGPAAG